VLFTIKLNANVDLPTSVPSACQKRGQMDGREGKGGTFKDMVEERLDSV